MAGTMARALAPVGAASASRGGRVRRAHRANMSLTWVSFLLLCVGEDLVRVEAAVDAVRDDGLAGF